MNSKSGLERGSTYTLTKRDNKLTDVQKSAKAKER